MNFFFRTVALSLISIVAPGAAYAGCSYAESSYYSQPSYYSQGAYYAQTYYQAAYATTTLSGNVLFTKSLFIYQKLSKGSGTFVIDHPLDPWGSLLYHSFVESPDVLNVYDGVATLDANGEALIQLPDYFEALNTDFRYQTFPHYEPMPGLHVKEGVEGNTFTVAGGAPGGEFTWQVTAERHDPYILANPIIPEVRKGPDELLPAGQCLHEPLCL